MPHPQADRIIELRKEGFSFNEIAENLRVSKSTASRIGGKVTLTETQMECIKQRGIKKSAAKKTKETPTHKYCPKCNKTLSKDNFHKRGKHLMGYCKKCQCKYVTDQKRKVREKLRSIVQQHKNRPCVDCNQNHPHWAMDFDHRDRGEKRFTIGQYGRLYWVTEDVLLEEIKKCDVVCALCHRYRTYGNGARRSG